MIVPPSFAACVHAAASACPIDTYSLYFVLSVSHEMFGF